MIKRKKWSEYTQDDIEAMAQAVAKAHEDAMFTPEYVAAYLGLSPATLQKMRCEKSDGIRFNKIGGHVRYRKSSIIKYIEDAEQTCTA